MLGWNWKKRMYSGWFALPIGVQSYDSSQITTFYCFEREKSFLNIVNEIKIVLGFPPS